MLRKRIIPVRPGRFIQSVNRVNDRAVLRHIRIRLAGEISHMGTHRIKCLRLRDQRCFQSHVTAYIDTENRPVGCVLNRGIFSVHIRHKGVQHRPIIITFLKLRQHNDHIQRFAAVHNLVQHSLNAVLDILIRAVTVVRHQIHSRITPALIIISRQINTVGSRVRCVSRVCVSVACRYRIGLFHHLTACRPLCFFRDSRNRYA